MSHRPPEPLRDGEKGHGGEQKEDHKTGEAMHPFAKAEAEPRDQDQARGHDETGRGNCRLPVSWRIEYRDGSDWKPVKSTETYQVAKDQWCAVRFAPVKTASLRLVVQLPANFATGVHEWKVDEVEEEL